METMVKKILEIDSKLQNLSVDKEQEMKKADSEIQKKTVEINNKYEEMFNEQSQKISIEETESANIKVFNTENEVEKLLFRMNSQYENSYEDWVDRIFNRITKQH